MDPRSDFRALAGAVLACDGISETTRKWWHDKLQSLELASLLDGIFGGGSRA